MGSELFDPCRNPTNLIPALRKAYIVGGAAGNHTLTGITVEDRIIQVFHHPPAAAQAAGSHVVSTAEDTAGTLDIVTGLAAIDSFEIFVLTAGGVHRPLVDAAISVTGVTITVADGGATFAVVDTDVIYWFAQDNPVTAALPVEITSEFVGAALGITAAGIINNAGGTNTTSGYLEVIYQDADWGRESDASWNPQQ